MQQVFLSICSRCGHAWRSRRGKPLRCAKCKSPYWDRSVPGRKTRWIVRPPDPGAAACGGRQISIEQACDILRTWQANRSWVAFAIEDNLALLNCSGFLRSVDPGRVEISDAQEAMMRFFMTLPPKGTFKYEVAKDERADSPYETLLIHSLDSLVYIGAWRVQPSKPAWLIL